MVQAFKFERPMHTKHKTQEQLDLDHVLGSTGPTTSTLNSPLVGLISTSAHMTAESKASAGRRSALGCCFCRVSYGTGPAGIGFKLIHRDINLQDSFPDDACCFQNLVGLLWI